MLGDALFMAAGYELQRTHSRGHPRQCQPTGGAAVVGCAGPVVAGILMPQEFHLVVGWPIDQLIVAVVYVDPKQFPSDLDDAFQIDVVAPPRYIL